MVPLRSFSLLLDKKTFDRKNTTLMQEKFRYHNLSETRTGPRRIFLVRSDTKNSTDNRDTSPSFSIIFFRNQKFFRTQKGSPTKIFGTSRQRNSVENHDTQIVIIPLLCIKCFNARSFLEKRRCRLRAFLCCETKIFRQKIMISTSYAKVFSYIKSTNRSNK